MLFTRPYSAPHRTRSKALARENSKPNSANARCCTRITDGSICIRMCILLSLAAVLMPSENSGKNSRFNDFELARVFRAKLLHRLSADGLSIPVGMPKKWVVDCCNVGNGEPALKILFALANVSIGKLSRYLYRGVIRERDLTGFDAKTGIVRFRYIDASTKQTAYRPLPISDFLWRIL